MVRPQEEMNYFAIMGLTPSATEAEIRKAYRKQSLALHPDKNRDMDPELASARFHEMQLAYEVLMDPSARLAAAERNKAEEARKERRGAYEGKRKEMADELERREEEDRLKRYKGAQDAQQRQATLAKLKEEGRKLREEKETKILQEEEQMRRKLEQQQEQRRASPPIAAPADMPELGPLDLTVRLRIPTDQLPDLMDLISGSSLLDSPLARGLEARFGKLDSLICRAPKKDKAKRETTAHATFNTLDSAYAAVKAGSKLGAGGEGPAAVLEDVWIGWAAGSKARGAADDPVAMSGEPARIAWLRSQGRLFPGSTDGGDRSDTGNEEEAAHTPEHDILQRMKARSDDAYNDDSAHTSSISSPFPSFSFVTSTPSQGTHSSKTSDGPEQQTSFDDFETSTLQKMRQAERTRMEEAIRQLDEQPVHS